MLLLSGHNRHQWLIPVSLLASFLWQAWPHSFDLRTVAPDAILLTTLYWSLHRPQDIGPGTGFIIGLFRDSIDGNLLGQHALSMVIMIYLTQLLSQRLRMFAVWQQSAVIGLLCLFYLLISNWVHLLTHSSSNGNTIFLLPALTTGLCWPPCYLLLRLLGQGRQIRPQ